jgi:hypothetical protein
MSNSFKFEELDDSTREYLHEAKARAGRGMPGVFVNKGNSKPVWAFILGPIIAIALLFMSMGSMKDAWAVAMLQTAGLLLGGWFTLYAFRRWTAGRSKIYGGYFLYFDPLHVYDVAGEKITIFNLESVRSVIAHPTEGGGRVDFDLGYEQFATIVLPSTVYAATVESYYGAMAELEQRDDGKWSSASAAEIGAAAKYIVENDEIPEGTEVLQLDVSTVPQTPTQERRAGWGFGPIFLWMLATGLAFGLLWMANIPLQDSFAFSQAKQAGAPGLRAYLLDDRNTMHRDEAKQMLAKLYEKPITAIRSSATPATNPVSRDGLVAILEALKTTESQPIVTLRVESIDVPDPNRSANVQTDLADSMGQTIGQELIAFAAAPEGAKPHILIRYLDHKDGQPINIDVFFRLDPDSEKADHESHFTIKIDNQAPQIGAPDQIAVTLAKELAGDYRSRPLFIPDFE